MPTLREQLQALLQPLAAGKAWPMVNTSESAVYPYIVYQNIVSVRNDTFDGPCDLQFTRVQVDVYALSVAEMHAVGTAVANAFADWAVPNSPLTCADLSEPQVKAYRLTQDFSVHSVD